VPAAPHRPRAAVQGGLPRGAVVDAPPVHGGVLHVDTPFAHAVFAVARAPRVGDRPADARATDLRWDMGPCEAYGPRLSPSPLPWRHSGRSSLTASLRRHCDKTIPFQVLRSESLLRAKVTCSEAAVHVAHALMTRLGGTASTGRLPFQCHVRDARAGVVMALANGTTYQAIASLFFPAEKGQGQRMPP
jgi:hypothetical protein